MSGQRRLDGNLRRLEVACLTDHDAIGILPQKRPQDARKRQANGFVHRYLHNSFQIVFDGLFRGEQLRIDRVDLAQTGIKRRRLSRAGRAGRDKNAVWAMDHFDEKVVDVIGHAECFEVEIHNATVEHTQHEALAELRR